MPNIMHCGIIRCVDSTCSGYIIPKCTGINFIIKYSKPPAFIFCRADFMHIVNSLPCN